MSTIVFTMRFEGSEAATAKVREVGTELNTVEEQLERIAQSSAKLDALTSKFTQLEKDLEKANTQAAALQATLDNEIDLPNEEVAKLNDELLETTRLAGILETEFDDVGEEIKVLNRELRAGAGSTTEEYAQLQQRLGQLNALVKESRDEVRRQQRAFQEASEEAGSYRQLNFELTRLRAEFRGLGKDAREGIGGRDLLNRIQDLDKELKKIDDTLGINVRNVGNYRLAISRLQQLLASFQAFEIFGTGLREVIEANADFTDSVADVAKTFKEVEGDSRTAKEEVAEFAEAVGQLDTRTSLADRLQIGAIGGQLGVAGEELLGFTAAIDQANVALGDELGGNVDDIASRLGRLAENLVPGSSEDIGTRISRIGSAINELGASGSANAGKIADFATRLQGVAAPANFSASAILGLGARLDELGIAPEASATAIQNLILSLGEDVPKFAGIAGVSIQEFSRTLQEDGNEALLAVLEGVNATGAGVEEISSILERLGIDSARAGNVVSGLANNVDALRRNQEIAADAFRENISLTQEFEVKNQTLGAQVDKLQNAFIALIVNTDLQEFLTNVIGLIIGLVQGIGRLPAVIGAAIDFVEEYKEEFILLGIALVSFNANLIAAQANIIRTAVVSRTTAAATRAYAVAQRLLNVALSANPIGIVIGLLALLATGIVSIVRNITEVRETVNGAFQAFDEFTASLGIFGDVLQFLVLPFRALITAALNLQATWEGVKAGAQQLATNVVNTFSKLATDAQIVFLRIKRAFTFDDAAVAEINGQLNSLEIESNRLAEQGKSAAEAFTGAFQAEAARIREAAQAEAEAGGEATVSPVAPSAPGGSTTNTTTDDNQPVGSFIKPPTQQEIDKAIEDRRRAAERIRDLEIQLLGENARAVAEAQEQARRDIAGLVGSQEQILEQETLIRATLRQTLSNIYEEQRTTLLQQAQEQVENIGEAGGLLPSIEEIQLQAEEVRGQLEDSIDQIFTSQREALLQQNQEAIANLVGSPEQVQEQTALLQQELENSLQELASQRATFNQELNIADQERQQAVLDLQLQSLEQLAEQEKIKREAALAARLEQLKLEAEAEDLAIEEIKARRQEIEEEDKLARDEADLELLEQRLELLRNAGEAEIAIEEDIAARRLRISQETLKAEIANREKLEKQERSVADARKNALKGFVGSVKSLLQEDENTRKKFAGALKAIAIAEIGINLQQELSAIFKVNTKFGEPIDTIIKAATAGAAIARAGIAVAKINSESFERGGDINQVSDQSLGGSRAAAAPAVFTPDSVSNARLEVDENGNLVRRQPQGLPGYRPAGKSFVVGKGYVPFNGGEIQGERHSNGGVKVVNEFGNLVELENGEFYLKNGSEAYAINRTSSRLFNTELRAINSLPDGQLKKSLASRINSYNGYGVSFESGGIIQGFAPIPSSPIKRFVDGGVIGGTAEDISFSPVAASLPAAGGIERLADLDSLRRTERLQETEEENNQFLRENMELLNANLEAVNNRIDRIQLLASPEDLVRAGLEAIEENENAGL